MGRDFLACHRGLWLFRWGMIGVLLFMVVAQWSHPSRASAAPSMVYFPATGHHLSDLFLTFWRTNGGLPIFGYPLTEPLERDGMRVQYFERARFEFHAELSNTPYAVQLELLGNEFVEGRTDAAFQRMSVDPSFRATADRTYHPETGHYLSYGFKRYWETHGGLPIFGYPISEEFTENGYTVQYFERARFEWHPEYRGTEYEILLGLLGVAAAERDQVPTASVERAAGVPDYHPSLYAEPRSIRVPVLMYHQVGPGPSRYAIPLWKFEQQMDWLTQQGYTSVTIAQLYDYMFTGGTLPSKPVVITFDDSTAGQWNAAGALDARGMKGVFFVVTGDSQLSPDQLHSLANRGHEIGSHSVSHPSLPALSSGNVAYQVEQSRRYLESVTGKPVDFFAYPFGNYNGAVAAAVEAAGYRGGIAAWGGHDWTPDKRWWEPRIEVSGLLSLSEFAALVQ